MDNIEKTETTTQNYNLEFFGRGSDFFKIMIVNWLNTSLKTYYPTPAIID